MPNQACSSDRNDKDDNNNHNDDRDDLTVRPQSPNARLSTLFVPEHTFSVISPRIRRFVVTSPRYRIYLASVSYTSPKL
jgi:hypothetical protein